MSNVAPQSGDPLNYSWIAPRNNYSALEWPLQVAGDRLLGVSDRHTIYAINMYSGDELHTKGSKPGGGFPYTSRVKQPAPPAITDGAVFFVEKIRDGDVTRQTIKALQLSDGSVRPDWVLPDAANVAALLGFPGVVVALQSTDDGGQQASAFRTSDGSPAWKTNPIPITQYSGGAVACAEDALFFVAGNWLRAVNCDFGDVRFPQFNLAAGQNEPAAPWTLDQNIAPLVDKKVVICFGDTDTILAFDRVKGLQAWSSQKWSATLPANSGATTWRCGLGQGWTAALRSDGLLCIIDTSSGDLMAQMMVEPGSLIVTDSYIHILTSDFAWLNLVRFDPVTKTIASAGRFALSETVAAAGPSIGNGTVFIPVAASSASSYGLVAKPYVGEQAAYFSGDTHIDVAPGSGDFNFGPGDFTVEVWVRSTEGGEIICGYPAASDTQAHGFRVNLGPRGEIRFAALNAGGSNQDLARTRATRAADGTWHHVAVARKSGTIAFYLDGVSLPSLTLHIRNGVPVHENGTALKDGQPVLDTLTPPPPPAPCVINAPKGLTIGAFIADGQDAGHHFSGLMRELRIWDLGLDAVTLQNRMVRSVPGTVEHLRGNWHLDLYKSGNTDGSDVENEVLGNKCHSTFASGKCVATDLRIDDSAFPYLLHQSDLQWPYASSWIVRGEAELRSAAAISSDGVVAFSTNHHIYGVRRSDGARLWSFAVAVGCSAPVVERNGFLVLTEEYGVGRIASRTGEFTPIEKLSTLRPLHDDTVFPAPATDGRFIAAATQNGQVAIYDSLNNTTVSAKTDISPSDLVIEEGVIYTVAGTGSRALFAIRADKGEVARAEVSSEAFCVYGSRVFCIQHGRLVQTGPDLQGNRAQAAAATVSGDDVTGMSADPDANLLVVSTSRGELLGLSFATLGSIWRTTVPDGSAGTAKDKGHLNEPYVDGRHVYCTSRSGAVAAFDGHHGEMRGFFQVAYPVITPPVEEAGVVYFGCADAPEHSMVLDGALHTVVFGRNYALRLGLNPKDQNVNASYAKISGPATIGDTGYKVLTFRDPRQSCVEAWVNTSSGGEVLSIRPSAETNLGLRFWLQADSAGRPADARVHFQIIDRIKTGETFGPWRTMYAHAPAHGLFNGMWHHVAVSAKSETEVSIYIDGQAQTVDLSAVAPANLPADTDTGFLAYLGADATPPGGAPGNIFHGLIDEVRLWDTFLDPLEIGDRLQEKLRGDEADLLAYWTFRSGDVHDESRNGYDGELSDGATLWLTDLSFNEPSHGYITTAAEMTVDGHDHPEKLTTYRLRLKVHHGNGDPLPHHDVQFWYVRHGDIKEPEQITLATNTSTAALTGILPNRPEPDTGASSIFTARTNPNGEIVLMVSTPLLDHGPSLDVRAAFMPQNERYHVNVLLDNQKLSRPAPPKLVAQAKLIQDYHWSPGSQINSDRGRPTYRATFTALNGDNSPRVHEPIDIYATGFIQIEVARRQFSLTQENGQTFETDAEGKITLLADAVDLKPPSLSVHAGFMPPGSRYVINLAEEAHQQLSKVQGNQMKDPDRMTRWKPAREGGPVRESLLKDGREAHADKVADAVRHVMASGMRAQKEQQPPLRAMRSAPGTPPAAPQPPAASRPKFADMTQPAMPPLGDRVRALHTLSHINRQAPISPQAMRASLPPGALGFEFTATDDGVIGLKYLMTHEQVRVAMTPTTPRAVPPDELPFGSAVKDAWSAMRDAARAAVEKATRIAVSIGAYVRVAITKAGEIATMVVRTIEHAIDVVFEFFKNLALMIIEIIEFLLMMFDFEAIIKTHDILKTTMVNAGPFLTRTVGDGGPIAGALASMEKVLTLSSVSDTGSPDSPSSVHQEHAGTDHALLGHCHSVGAQSLYTKTNENHKEMTFKQELAPATVHPSGSGEHDNGEFLSGLLDLVPQLPTMKPADAANALLNLLKLVGEEARSAALTTVRTAASAAAGMMNEVMGILNVEIDIPFISALYKWITGSELTLLSLLCLVLGMVVHVAYLLFTLGREFYKDAAHINDALLPRTYRAMARFDLDRNNALAADEDSHPVAAAPAENPLSYGAQDARGVEAGYVCFKAMNIAASIATDGLFAAEAPEVPSPYPDRDLAKVVRGLSGIMSSCLMFTYSTPDLVKRLAAEAQRNPGFDMNFNSPVLPDKLSHYYAIKNIAVFVLGMIGDLMTLSSGLTGYKGKLNKGKDLQTYWFLRQLNYVYALLILHQFIEFLYGPEYSGANSDSDLRNACKLFFARDILNQAAKTPGYLFTETATDRGTTAAQLWVATAFRGTAHGAAIGCHAGAEFGYLKQPE